MKNLPNYDYILNNTAYVINLKRKKERYEHTRPLLENAGFKKLVQFEAIDGVAVRVLEGEFSKRYLSIFENFGLTEIGGKAGCALSHFTLWTWCAFGSSKAMMIFEDDALPRPDFQEILPKYWGAIEKPVDIVFLGNQLHPDDIDDQLISYAPTFCLHAYFITKTGAEKLLFLWNKFQLVEKWPAVDIFTIKMIEKGHLMAASMIGNTIPMKGELKGGQPWPDRDTGIIFQNFDLGTTIHEMETVWM